MRPVSPWSRPSHKIAAALSAGVAMLAAVLIYEADSWGLVPPGSRANPMLITLVRLGIGLAACLLVGGVAGWIMAGRSAQRRAGLNLEVLACRQLTIIRERVYDYMRRYGGWPPTLAHVGFTERMLINPWGQPYQYVVHGDRFTILTEMPDRLYDYFALEGRWLGGPGANLLTFDQTEAGWY